MQEMHQHEEMHAAEPSKQPLVQFSRDSICVSRKMLLTVGVLVGVFALGMLVSSGINNVGKAKIATKSRANESLTSFASTVQTQEQAQELISTYEREFPYSDAFLCQNLWFPQTISAVTEIMVLNRTNPQIWIGCTEGCNRSTGRCNNASYDLGFAVKALGDCGLYRGLKPIENSDGASNYLMNCSDYTFAYCANGVNKSSLTCNSGGGSDTTEDDGTKFIPVGNGHGSGSEQTQGDGWQSWTAKEIKAAAVYKDGLRSVDKEFLTLLDIYGRNNVGPGFYFPGDENVVIKVREVDDKGIVKSLNASEQCHKGVLRDFVNVFNIINSTKYSPCSGVRLQFSHNFGGGVYLVVTHDTSFNEQNLITGRDTTIYRIPDNSIYELPGKLPDNVRYMFFASTLTDRRIEIGSGRVLVSELIETPSGGKVLDIAYKDSEGKTTSKSSVNIIDAVDPDTIN